MKKVMIVDDSPFVYELMKSFLEDSDYSIAGYVKNGEDAVGMYEEISPDIVTMDIILPGMDGLETARAILDQWPGAKIVFVSSLAYDDTIDESKEIGAIGFVCKPFEKDDLINALNKC